MTEKEDGESLISHLEALRETLLKCIISLCVGLPFTLYIAPKALNWLIDIIPKRAPSGKSCFKYF